MPLRAGWSLLLLSIGPVSVLGQTSPAACLSSFDWMNNSEDQNPCVVTAYLQAACNGGDSIVYPLVDRVSYTGPTAYTQNPCRCSSVTYNTKSACGLCQGHPIISWNTWNFNCTNGVYPGVFPVDIPDGTAIPQWAFQDVTQSNLFNATLAQIVGDSPESTAAYAQSATSAAAQPTSTDTPASLTAAPSGSSFTSTSSGSSTLNTGVIAGSVVGGVVGVALVGAVIIFLVKKHHQAALLDSHVTDPTSRPTTCYSDGATFFAEQKFYDPSDPSTFPTSTGTISSPSSNIHSPIANYPTINYSTNSVQHSGHYTGAPEI